MRILDFLDFFVPVAIRNDSREHLIRARVLVVALLLGCVVTALAELPSLLPGGANAKDQTAGLLVMGFVEAFYAGCLIIFKRSASLTLAGNIYGVGAYSGITAAVALTGGFQKSPFLQILLIVPLFLFLICGRRWGYLWTGVIIVTFSVFFGLSLAGIEVPDLASTAHQNIIVFSLWVLLCFSLMTCLAIYDGLNENLAWRIRRERDKFEHEAAHDLLTGLANRRTYHHVLAQGIEECRAAGTRLTLLIIDLNGFKPINDRLGHHAGDHVLRVVAERLKHAVRSSDTVSRMGGDEFSVLLHANQDMHAVQDASMGLQVARKIQDGISEPIKFEDQLLSVSASIGIAVYPEDGQDPDALTKHADRAMYSAKQSRFRIQG
jgi:diguanylate cyclase (GGDEF)-like protein